MKPLTLPLCANCFSRGIKDQYAVGYFEAVGLSPVLRRVPLCRACAPSFEEYAKLIESCEALSAEETFEFFQETFLKVMEERQVSGIEQPEEAPEEAPEARVPADEAPALFPASKTAQKALEATPAVTPKKKPGPKPDHTFNPPSDAEPRDWVQCGECNDGVWMKYGSRPSHMTNRHPGRHQDQLVWLPEGKYPCTNDEGLAHGCKASFFTADKQSRHSRLEHLWATRLARAANISPIEGAGRT